MGRPRGEYVDQLLQVPAGAITLRDDRTQEQWTVPIAPFTIAKDPVTQNLYQAVTGTNPSAFQSSRQPVETVSWLEAARFCNQLSTRLGLEPCYKLEAVGKFEFFRNPVAFRMGRPGLSDR